jgi:hypothetical protein
MIDHIWHIHAGRKDWRKGGKPICGVGDQGWCYLAPSIASSSTVRRTSSVSVRCCAK